MEILTNILQPKVAKMTPADYAGLSFEELYSQLPAAPKPPKQALIEAIAELCCVHQQTVRMWAYGQQQPDALKRKLIAEALGMDINTLFPSSQEQCEL